MTCDGHTAWEAMLGGLTTYPGDSSLFQEQQTGKMMPNARSPACCTTRVPSPRWGCLLLLHFPKGKRPRPIWGVDGAIDRSGPCSSPQTSLETWRIPANELTTC